jgi:uncharacterized small protein (DUF1192 family)
MNGLTKYDAARYALSVAVEVDEVKDIRDKAEAMAAYARQAKDTELVQWATEIKVRAERRAGQMLAEMDLKPGVKAIGHSVVPIPKTLSDLDITKNESSRWQKLAAVSESQFEQAVAAAKEVAGEVTTAAMLRAAKAEDPVKPVKATPKDYTVNPVDAAEPEDTGPDADELAANVAAEQSDRQTMQLLLDADDKLAAAVTEIKRLKAEVLLLQQSRDAAMNRANELTQWVKRRDYQIARLQAELGTLTRVAA